MASQAADNHRTLEEMLCDEIGEPLSLKLYLLQAITNDFSEVQAVGSGAYGTVYKGVIGDGFVAVKKLYSFHAIKDEVFQQEVDCLMRVRHQNIVWFVGYCAETRVEVVREGVKNLFVEHREKLLCFEYLHNGSLRNYLRDEPCGLSWHICYQIIKGICLGLHYLHERHIIHLDLKPDNILLDDGMVPKIADFGLSRLLDEGRSRVVTQKILGTIGYMAPEYLSAGTITTKSDIFSLGMIIREMLMGRSTGATTENVLQRWMRRLEQDSSPMTHATLGICYWQIKACIEITESCMESKPEKRPDTQDILQRLEKTESGIQPIVATVPAVMGRISFLSKLMGNMQSMAVTLSQQRSTQVKSSKALAIPMPSALPKGPGDTNPDKSFWLDGTRGAKCYMLSSRSLRINWGETPGHWKWISLPESRFAECAELLDVYWLAVIGEIPTEDLTADIRYAVYLVYKLASTTTGLKGVQKSSIRLYGQRVVSTRMVSVDPAATRATGVTCMELKLAEFAADEQMLGEKAVIVDFREENDHVKKSGIIIEGMEFRPSS